MENNQDIKLLRIFVGESDKLHGQPIYEAIVIEAKRLGLRGATVLRGLMGFGANSLIHRAGLLEISSDLPMVIEIVDEEVRIRSFTETVKKIFSDADSGGLITLEKIEVIKWEGSKRKGKV